MHVGKLDMNYAYLKIQGNICILAFCNNSYIAKNVSCHFLNGNFWEVLCLCLCLFVSSPTGSTPLTGEVTI